MKIFPQVYDISQWKDRHPGGATVLTHYAGEDATVCVFQIHINTILNILKQTSSIALNMPLP